MAYLHDQVAGTPPEIKDKLETIVNGDYLTNLYLRWQDEKEYEDIDDYGAAFGVVYNATIVKCTRNPFGFHFKFADFPQATYSVKHTARYAEWSRVS